MRWLGWIYGLLLAIGLVLGGQSDPLTSWISGICLGAGCGGLGFLIGDMAGRRI